MTERIRFDLKDLEPFTFMVDGERYRYADNLRFAEIGNSFAGIHSTVFRTRDDRYLYVVVVADQDAANNPHGVHHGWYVAEAVSQERAGMLRSSWAVLRTQPTMPPMPSGRTS